MEKNRPKGRFFCVRFLSSLCALVVFSRTREPVEASFCEATTTSIADAPYARKRRLREMRQIVLLTQMRRDHVPQLRAIQ